MTLVSSTLPAMHAFNNIHPQVWSRWVVSQPMASFVLGLITTVILYILYRIITRSTTKKTMKTLCFIHIHPTCIDNLSTDKVVRVVIKDAQEKCLVTRNLSRFHQERGENISAQLPSDTAIKVYLMVTREGQEIISDPFQFKVQKQPHQYNLYFTKTELKKMKRQDKEEGCWAPLEQDRPKYPAQASVRVCLHKTGLNMIEENPGRPGRIILDASSNETWKDVQVLLQAKNGTLPGISLSYPMNDRGIDSLDMSQLIQDWKAAFELETGKEFDQDIPEKDFYLQSIVYQSYTPSEV